MDERRDYKSNGLGRREYDKSPCPFYDNQKHKCGEVEDVRNDLKNKVSTKMFGIFVASAGAFMIFLAGTLISLNYKSLEKTDSIKDEIVELKTEAAKVATQQSIIMRSLHFDSKDRVNDENF
jgi:hypothetical protein